MPDHGSTLVFTVELAVGELDAGRERLKLHRALERCWDGWAHGSFLMRRRERGEWRYYLNHVETLSMLGSSELAYNWRCWLGDLKIRVRSVHLVEVRTTR